MLKQIVWVSVKVLLIASCGDVFQLKVVFEVVKRVLLLYLYCGFGIIVFLVTFQELYNKQIHVFI